MMIKNLPTVDNFEERASLLNEDELLDLWLLIRKTQRLYVPGLLILTYNYERELCARSKACFDQFGDLKRCSEIVEHHLQKKVVL